MYNFLENLEASLHKGFVNQNHKKATTYHPQLLVNHSSVSRSVLDTLINELETSQSFIFSVAFITESGLATLKSVLLDLKEKGVKGRILTSTYLTFNQPKIFRELMKIENVEVRLTSLKGFHAKGYIFEKESHYSLIVGSSNLTAHALKVNYEWNVKLTSHEDGEIIHHFKDQFEHVWSVSETLTKTWIEAYEKHYALEKQRQEIEQVIEMPVPYLNTIEEAVRIEPNKMQEAALAEIQALRDAGKQTGLVISATGTGKTFLSAFDVRKFAPKRMLFIVHREQILHKAKEDYKRVLGGMDEEFGVLSGTSKDIEKKYLFATIQTISKPTILNHFNPDTFDYVLIDEVHKAGASSYARVMEYFKPSFLMGMTATPERSDDYNIYSLFDYNVAYEIRLQEALEEEMLCPFHYFGVTELEVNGLVIDDSTAINQLVTEERVKHVIDKINYYGYSGKRVHGLMFCSRKEEAHSLSNALNTYGYRTAALTGEHSQSEREQRVKELEAGELDYILTVDIFNEGIDIPCVNQVVMLRQTESSIIFIQQLGRGLRKHRSKEYVTIIDFIGNYKTNYLIPIALSGDQSLNKDTIRRKTKDTSYIRGASTINFEAIAKSRIFQAIDSTKLSTMKVLKEAYIELKNRLGRVPYLKDFLEHHSVDPEVLVGKGNYYEFLVKTREEVPLLSSYEKQVLTMLSQEILNGKRLHEVILFEMLLEKEYVSHSELKEALAKNQLRTDDNTLHSLKRHVDLTFHAQVYRKKYGEEPIVISSTEGNSFSNKVSNCLSTNAYFYRMVTDVLRSARIKNQRYSNHLPLTLYEKYSRKDACKLLNWENDESSTIYGYKTKHQTCPIFVTYHKQEDLDKSISYHEEFLNQEVLRWSTRSKRTTASKEVIEIMNADEENIDLHLFVKKDNDEGTDFYYLGKARYEKESAVNTKMPGKDGQLLDVVHMDLVLEHKVDDKLYSYLVEGTSNG
ncbi:DEAD/DEAH box helicase [Alkalihalobacillus sp. FSL W8-0930]